MPNDTRSEGDTDPVAVQSFIARWERSGAAERANYQLFLSELCDIIGVPRPDPATADDAKKARIRDLAEQLDAHRKQRQAEHPKLTMTGMYNVLEKLRRNEPLTPADRTIHEQGLVSVLKQLHDDLDAAVFEAYGWPVTLTDQQILEKLVSLNAERAAEEAKGRIRWLRPEYQKARSQVSGDAGQEKLGIKETLPEPGTRKLKSETARRWPRTLPEQVRALRDLLVAQSAPVTAEVLAKSFLRAPVATLEEILQTLVTLGQARAVGEGKYVAG